MSQLIATSFENRAPLTTLAKSLTRISTARPLLLYLLERNTCNSVKQCISAMPLDAWGNKLNCSVGILHKLPLGLGLGGQLCPEPYQKGAGSPRSLLCSLNNFQTVSASLVWAWQKTTLGVHGSSLQAAASRVCAASSTTCHS